MVISCAFQQQTKANAAACSIPTSLFQDPPPCCFTKQVFESDPPSSTEHSEPEYIALPALAGQCFAHKRWPLKDLEVPFSLSTFAEKTFPDQAAGHIPPRAYGVLLQSPSATTTPHTPPSAAGTRAVASRQEHYVGHSWCGMRDGIGSCLSETGDAYAGEWCCNRKHGWGFIARREGCYEGTWRNNEPIGFGLLVFPNDLKYLGQTDPGDTAPGETAQLRKHGRGVSVHQSGGLFSGTWQAGGMVSGSLLFPELDAAKKMQSFTTACSGAVSVDDNTTAASSSPPPTIAKDQTPSRQPFTCEFPPADTPPFRTAKQRSHVLAIHVWDPSELSAVFTSCAVPDDVAGLFVEHQISGADLLLLSASPDFTETLKRIGVSDSYVRRYIVVIVCLLMRVRRRCLLESEPSSSICTGLRLDIQQLVLERRIGGGGYGRVYKGKCDLGKEASTGGVEKRKRGGLMSGSNCAIKIFRSKGVNTESRGQTFLRLQRQQMLMAKELGSEAAILSELRHPNITLMYGVVESPFGCIVSEYVPCGSLFGLLHRHMTPINLPQGVRLAGEVASALAYIHARGIIHCDLKSSNILLNEVGAAKLCDFGLASCLKKAPDIFSCEADTEAPGLFLGSVGTLHWMAPEVVRGEPYTKASDIYSFGATFWEIISRRVPFRGLLASHLTTLAGYHGVSPYDPVVEVLRRSIRRGGDGPGTKLRSDGSSSPPQGRRLQGLPKGIASILTACLHANPLERPSALELAAFFNNLGRSQVLLVEENLKVFFGMD